MAKLVRDTRGRVLTDSFGRNLSEGTKWHSKLTRYYNNVIKSQGNSSSILPYLNLINEKLIENDGQVMFFTYENTTELRLRIQTESGSNWEVDWDGSGDWQSWNSSAIDRTETFTSPTSGVAFIRSATGNSIEDINNVQSTIGNWNFDISTLSNVSYQVLFGGSSSTLTYTTTTWVTIPSNIFQLGLSSGHLTQSEVDQLFIDLNNAGTTGEATIDFRGSNAAPSTASASARTALASRGYNLLHN